MVFAAYSLENTILVLSRRGALEFLYERLSPPWGICSSVSKKKKTKWLARKLSSSDHRTLLSKPLIFFFPSSCSPLLVYSLPYYIYPNFWKHTSKRARIFAQEPGDSQVSGHCGEKKHRGLAVLVGLIVKLSPRANTPWVGKGPPCQSLGGEGAAKAWYLPLILLWESQCTGHACL